MSVLEKFGLKRPRRMTAEEYAAKLIARGVGPDGHFVVSGTPLAPPIGYVKQPSLVEVVRDMVRGERLRQLAQEADLETFEESEDFEIDDEAVQLRSQWENEFDPPLAEITQAVEEERKKKPAKPKKGASDAGVAPPTDGPGAPDGDVGEPV